jgi:hypothetical protein
MLWSVELRLGSARTFSPTQWPLQEAELPRGEILTIVGNSVSRGTVWETWAHTEFESWSSVALVAAQSADIAISLFKRSPISGKPSKDFAKSGVIILL